MNPLQEYYEQLDEPNRSCLLAIRQLILNLDKQISETLSWNMPFFKYRKKMLCYFWFDKKKQQYYLSFSEGKHINHPALTSGNRERFKVYYFDTSKDIDHKLIQDFIEQSMVVIDDRLGL